MFGTLKVSQCTCLCYSGGILLFSRTFDSEWVYIQILVTHLQVTPEQPLVMWRQLWGALSNVFTQWQFYEGPFQNGHRGDILIAKNDIKNIHCHWLTGVTNYISAYFFVKKEKVTAIWGKPFKIVLLFDEADQK